MSKGTVLITCATGHIGFRTLILTLDAGYPTHVTSRYDKTISKIKNAPSVQKYLNNIKFFVVPDITASDAYDQAIQGVEYFLHIASPIPTIASKPEGKTWKEVFYDPAKLGTVTVLAATARTPSVKRVVVTSTGAAVEPPAGKKFAGPCDIKPIPDESTAEEIDNVFTAYVVSKVMAHRAADDFVKEKKKSDPLGGTNAALLGAALGIKDESPKLTGQVLLEDTAVAHVLALKLEIASNGGNLLIAGNGGIGVAWDEVGKVVEELYPKEVASGVLNPVKDEEDYLTFMDVESSEKAL